MDATLLAMYNAFIIANATGAPLVPPVISPATSDESPSTSNSDGTATPNRKSDKEKERRERTNQLFDELYGLVKKDGDGKMSQAKILNAALKTAKNHKREHYSDPQSRGLYAALQKIERVSIQYSKTLYFPNNTETTAQRLEKLFEDFKEVVLPVFIPRPAPVNPPASLTPANGAATSENADEARKKKRANCEQGRRDTLDDGYSLLKQFIQENNLVATGNEKMQKIEILETIIRYLRYTPTPHLSQADLIRSETGRAQGRHLGQNLVVLFFKSDVHLISHYVSLFNFIESQLGHINPSTQVPNFEFCQTAVLNFATLHPVTYGLISSITPPPTDPPTPPLTPVQLPAPAPRIPGSIFRSWE